MRDIHITDNSGGGGFEALVGVAVIVVVAAVALQVAAAVASAVATILITVFWCLAGLAGLAVLGGIAYVALRLRRGLPLRRAPRAARPLPRGAVHSITDARPGQLPAPRLHPEDLRALAEDLAGRLGRLR